MTQRTNVLDHANSQIFSYRPARARSPPPARAVGVRHLLVCALHLHDDPQRKRPRPRSPRHRQRRLQQRWQARHCDDHERCHQRCHPLRPRLGNGQFGTTSQIADTTGVQGLDAGDVNGDGKADVIGATTSEVRIRFGNGTGGFTVGGTYPLTLGGQVEPLLVDLDGDHDLDIVSPTFTAIQTLINSGSGAYTAGPSSNVTGSCTLSAISIAKLNSGTTPDLFATDGCNSTTFALLGNGSGGFTVSGTLYGAGFVPEDVTAIDLDGNGCDDAATVGSFSFTLATGLTNCSGAFTSSTPVVTQYSGAGPTSATAGDFNRDGKKDLAVSSLASMNPTLKVLAGNGTASMSLVGDFAVGSAPQNPVVADYNLDGKKDIVTAGPGVLSFLANTTP